MSQDVTEFVRVCHWCQTRATTPTITRAIPFTLGANQPVFIDAFTRMVTLYPTKEVSTKEILKPLIAFCCLYGNPQYLHSDYAT